jgi:hypothetical protein
LRIEIKIYAANDKVYQQQKRYECYQLLISRDDTVPEYSFAEKKANQDVDDAAIGDKIDLRVCTSSPSGKSR